MGVPPGLQTAAVAPVISEKLPGLFISNVVGTVAVEGFSPWTRRKPSKSPKKKVLSFRMGPPMLPPN